MIAKSVLGSVLFSALLLDAIAPESETAYRFVLRQQLDSSCGYAAVASILALYSERHAEERDLIRRFSSGDKSARTSLYTMSQIFREYDIDARAYFMTYEELLQIPVGLLPGIAHVRIPQDHFVLVVAVNDKYVVVGDPAFGLGFTDRGSFCGEWSGNILVPFSGETGAMREAAISICEDRRRLLEESL